MKKSFLFIIITIFLVSSCNNFIEDYNIDPNGVFSDEVSAQDMIQGVMLANQFWQTGPASRLTMMWMNQATGSDRQYVSLNNWNAAAATDFDNVWRTLYANTMFHASIVHQKALVENNPHLAGIAKVIQGQGLGMAASLWGDVPFSQAFDYQSFPNPSYDAQASAYDAAQIVLDEAIVLLSTSTSVPVFSDITTDLYYEGNVSRWIELAHSYKARFYLHNKDYVKANAEALLGISNATGDFKAQFNNELGGKNPYFQFMKDDRVGYLTAKNAYGWQLLKPGQDNYRGHSKTKEHLRVLYNYKNTNDGEKADLAFTTSESKFAEASNMPLMTWGEMMLIQAEYQARTNGLSAGVIAYNTYRAALRTGYSIGVNDDCWGNPGACNSRYEDFVDADFAAGGLENTDGIDDLQALIREIYEERYVYFIGNFEAFTDYRRTNNVAEIQMRSFDDTPQRFLYPQAEVNSNSNIPSPIPDVSVATPIHN
ncbi:MAG TPA: SusD/RagB family nutrient-binding outer membrane lipoprotein [Lutibacter sp.]|nr:SusD/RagB family nutrient-binding outer membrane lipoprotein [Lutibacter sp.]